MSARLAALSEASGLPASVLAASLLDEGIKLRQFPGIVYKDGPSGRRASLADGPDVWQVIRALREAPEDGSDPVETVSIEADLHRRQIVLAAQFYEVYPDEVDAMIALDREAVAVIDEMIAERERAIAERQAGEPSRIAKRDDVPGLTL